MARHFFFVFSDAVEGRETQYHQWYERHVEDILALPGFAAAQRFESHDVEGRIADHGQLALYEIEGAPEEALANLRRAVTEGRLERPDPEYVAPNLRSFIFSPIGERMTGTGDC